MVEHLVVITYNIHSAMSEHRLELILAELHDIDWDIIVLVETWREEIEEKLVVSAGHTFYGSGGCRRSCGVGFFVHERHSEHGLVAVSKRLAVLSIKIGKMQFQVLGVYMPDSTHPDLEVAVVYEQLAAQLRTYRRKNATALLLATSMPKWEDKTSSMTLRL